MTLVSLVGELFRYTVKPMLGLGVPKRDPANYENWTGPWLVYNGTRVPLDIPGITPHASATVTVNWSATGGVYGVSSRIDSSDPETFRPHGIVSFGRALNGVNLEKYVRQFGKSYE
jgi:hypothetical protein